MERLYTSTDNHLFILFLLILCRHYRKILNQSIYIVADFGRYDNTVARLDKDIVAPYVHVLPSYNEDDVVDPYSKRDTLLFFRGRTHRKAVSPITGCYVDPDFVLTLTSEKFIRLEHRL